jgi:hypothetical protein
MLEQQFLELAKDIRILYEQVEQLLSLEKDRLFLKR